MQGSIQERGPRAAKKRPGEVDWFQKLKRARTNLTSDDGEAATETQPTVRLVLYKDNSNTV